MDSLPNETIEEQNVPATEQNQEVSKEENQEIPQVDSQEEPKKSRGVPARKRINQLVGQGHEKDRRISELESRLAEQEKASVVEKPNIQDYEDNPEAYNQHLNKYSEQQSERLKREAIEDYQVEQQQREVERKERKKFETYADSRRDAVNKYKDYEKSEGEVNAIINDFRANGLQNLLLECDNPTSMIDHYGRNPDKFEELANLYLSSPNGAARTIGRLETKLEKKKPTLSDAPAPLPKAGRNAGKTGFDKNNCTQEEYNRHYNNK